MTIEHELLIELAGEIKRIKEDIEKLKEELKGYEENAK